ncbi:MAG TPA: lysylphosphatidylglycerol synthase transmembrane domain-containing protein [Polyangiales bacterium]
MEADVGDRPADAGRSSPFRRRVWLAFKLLVVLGGFAFILSRQPLDEFADAAARMSTTAILSSLLLQLFALVLGTLRWRSLMLAYGASGSFPFSRLYLVYMVGQFYNIYVPGAVGGDLLRGMIGRRAFGERGATAGVAIVFVERVLGMAGVLFVTAVAVAFDRKQRLDAAVLPYCIAGMVGLAVLISAVTHGQRFAHLVPKKIGAILASLPKLSRRGPFALACVLSASIHVLISLCGVVLLAAIAPEVPAFDSFLAMPLSVAASFIPLSVGGSGPRDFILVALYGALGVPKSAALAVALGFLMTSLAAAGVGGIFQLVWRSDFDVLGRQ